jgi:hypothetical protein
MLKSVKKCCPRNFFGLTLLIRDDIFVILLQNYEKSSAEQRISILFMPRRSDLDAKCQYYEKSSAEQRISILFMPRRSDLDTKCQYYDLTRDSQIYLDKSEQ